MGFPTPHLALKPESVWPQNVVAIDTASTLGNRKLALQQGRSPAQLDPEPCPAGIGGE